ncbi:MAG: ABC transporter permease subunit [Treponema sp.]|jgi:putative aldouronate transport system permease protein|nr:ABC transporter permease subunit [Treponema sp.]
MSLPGLAVLIIFAYVPMYGILIAFKNYKVNLGIMGSPWVGQWFRQFFSNPFALRTVRNTVIIGFYSLLFGFPAPILLALLFNELKNGRFKKTVQTLSYYPHFVSTVIIVGFLHTFCASDGLFNMIVRFFGHETINFISDARWFRFLYVSSGIWQGVGFGTIIYLAALSGIDPTFYDVAEMDGANRFQKVLNVTLPHLRPTIVILFILAVGGLFGADTQKILLLYNAQTYETADVIGTYVYREGIQGARFEYSSAVGLFQTAINFFFLVFTNQIARKLNDTSLF